MLLPNNAVHEPKVPVIVRSEYTVSLERTSGLTFVHCDIKAPWSPKVKSSLMADWANFTALHDSQILALSDLDDLKHHKFLRMFGFKPVGDYLDKTLGHHRRIYIFTDLGA